jgi:hypothetical protein
MVALSAHLNGPQERKEGNKGEPERSQFKPSNGGEPIAVFLPTSPPMNLDKKKLSVQVAAIVAIFLFPLFYHSLLI